MIWHLITRSVIRLAERTGLGGEDVALNPNDDLAQVVRSLREGLGLTQQELAVRLGVALPTISRWENSRHTPSRLALDKIEALLHEMGEEGEALLEKYLNRTGPQAD
jgi:transcriptional regulator with XRE-family HTH domain